MISQRELTKWQVILMGVFILIAFALRMQAAIHDHTLPEKDALEYDQLAMNILHGTGYRDASGQLTAFRPPLYPFFLASVYALAGHDYQFARIIQAVLSTLTVLLIAVWALVLFGAWSACLATILAAIYPPFYAYYFSCSALITETLYVFLLTTALLTLHWYFSSPSRAMALISGLFWGLSALARGVALPFLFILPFILLVLRYPVRQILYYHVIVGIMVASVLAPWVVRNYFVFRAFVPVSTNGGASFYASNHLGSDGFGTKFYGEVIMPEDAKLKSVGQSEVLRSKYFFSKGMSFIQSHPAEAFRLFLWKTFLYMDPTNTLYQGASKQRILNWGYIGVLFGTVAGAFLGMRDVNFCRSIFLPLFIFAFFLFFHAFFHSSHRYRFPTEPILIAITSFTLESLGRWILERRSRYHKKQSVLVTGS